VLQSRDGAMQGGLEPVIRVANTIPTASALGAFVAHLIHQEVHSLLSCPVPQQGGSRPVPFLSGTPCPVLPSFSRFIPLFGALYL